HEAGVGGDRRPVVPGRIRDIHAGELADRGLVLEDRLQHALAHLGLVGGVRGQQLATLEHGVDDGGDVVVVDPRAEEAHLVDDVLGRELLEVPLQLGLRQRRLDRELVPVAHAGGDVLEQVVDGRDADRREHRLAVCVGDTEVAHASSRTFRYSSTESSWSRSPGLDIRMRISQPSPYGSSFTVSGASTTFWLTSSTSPESGEIRSETAFTDSTSPYDVSFDTVEPTSGGS